MSVQRRRGQPAQVYHQRLETDLQGNRQYVTALDEEPYEVKAAFIPQRGSRAEVSGQQQILVYRMILTSELADVGLWSRIMWRGTAFDVVSPPVYHHGTRATRHWSMDVRERPS